MIGIGRDELGIVDRRRSLILALLAFEFDSEETVNSEYVGDGCWSMAILLTILVVKITWHRYDPYGLGTVVPIKLT